MPGKKMPVEPSHPSPESTHSAGNQPNPEIMQDLPDGLKHWEIEGDLAAHLLDQLPMFVEPAKED
jgi:hypothetical protein